MYTTDPSNHWNIYSLAQKVTPDSPDTLLVFEFPRLLDALYLQFLFTQVSCALNDVIIRWRFGLVSNVVSRINEVNRRWARLVLGWVTVCRRVNHLGM